MDAYHLSDRDERLSDLVERAVEGERVDIMRDGRVVATLVPAVPSARRAIIDLATLQALTASLPPSTDHCGDAVRTLRDSDRY